MQGIFLRNLCMKQKAGRLRSVLRSASFAVDDQEWPPRVLWPCAAEEYFLIQQFGASADAPNCVFHEFTL
jgi:hypothetical protein